MEEYRKYEPIFGSWYLSKLIGKGSFGKVFEITREEYGTTYKSALKIITVPQDEDDARTRMMTDGSDLESLSEYYEGILKEIINENEIMAQLKGNSNIVSYEDHQVIPHGDGIGYDILIRMELLTPLVDCMMQKNLDEMEVVKLGIDMCRALEICHRRNIVHRDIKPQNIFKSDNGDYKLGDFGIARTIEKTTGGLSKKGTYKYMAPEVYRGENYDHTVDLYSLGLVLFSLLNGNRGPFLPAPPAKVTHNDEEEGRARRFRGEPVPDPRDAGAVLAMIIRKACAFYPQERYADAAQMRADLESYRANYGDADYIEKTVAQFPVGGNSYDPYNTGRFDPFGTGGYDQGMPESYSPVGRKTGSYNPVNTGRYNPAVFNTGNIPADQLRNTMNPYNTRNNIPPVQPVYVNDGNNGGGSRKGILIAGGIVIVALIVVIAVMITANVVRKDNSGTTTAGQGTEQADNGGADEDTGGNTAGYEEVEPETSEPEETTYDDSDYYIMPDADSRFYDYYEIEGFGKEKTQLAINELYARHGYIFKEEDMYDYFIRKPWYDPTEDKIDPKTDFNKYEFENHELLVRHREELK